MKTLLLTGVLVFSFSTIAFAGPRVSFRTEYKGSISTFEGDMQRNIDAANVSITDAETLELLQGNNSQYNAKTYEQTYQSIFSSTWIEGTFHGEKHEAGFRKRTTATVESDPYADDDQGYEEYVVPYVPHPVKYWQVVDGFLELP